MIAIIPALLRTDEDVEELASTLRSIPADIVGKCVIASKGLEPKLERVPREREYVLVRGDLSTSKWGSITQGLRALGDTTERVLLIDADDPFESTSLREFCEYAEKSDADCVVGRRDRVILVAQDQRTPLTRLYIEVFSNTLLLVRLGQVERGQRAFEGPDIQSGLYALPADVLRRVSFERVKSYGGELTLYQTLAASGARIDERIVRAHEVLESSYLSRDIFRAMLELPFLADVTDEEIGIALSEGPRLYAEWMTPGNEATYREEIQALLQQR